jgi:hypothetical protein
VFDESYVHLSFKIEIETVSEGERKHLSYTLLLSQSNYEDDRHVNLLDYSNYFTVYISITSCIL